MVEHACPRRLRGYGRNPPRPQWPDEAETPCSSVVNFEEGGENDERGVDWSQ
jgi:hypothetical protein